MKKSYLILVFFLLTISCGRNKDSQKNIQIEAKIKHEKEINHNSCMRQELDSCIRSYLNEIDSKFPDFLQVFYTVYCFEKDEKELFTIWGFNSLPFYLESQNPSYSFNYTIFNIKGKNIILITKDGNKNPKLYSLCKEKTGKDKLGQIKKNEYDIIYDGSWFPKTYEYRLEDDTYIILESDSLYVDFLGNDFLRFEKSLTDNKTTVF